MNQPGIIRTFLEEISQRSVLSRFSEAEPQRELHFARTFRAEDPAEIRCSEDSIGQIKIGPVE